MNDTTQPIGGLQAGVVGRPPGVKVPNASIKLTRGVFADVRISAC